MKKVVLVEDVLYSQISNVLYRYLNLGYTHISTLFTGRNCDLDEQLYSIFFSCEEQDLGITNVRLIYDSNIDGEVNYAMEKDIEVYQMYLGENDTLLSRNLRSIRLRTDDGKYRTYLKRPDGEFDYTGVI